MSPKQRPQRQQQTHFGEEPSVSGIPERHRRLLETTPLIPWEADATTWRFTYVGPQAVKLLGYPLEEWYEKDFWTAHLHPEDREHAVDFCAESSGQCKDYEFKYRMVTAAVPWWSLARLSHQNSENH